MGFFGRLFGFPSASCARCADLERRLETESKRNRAREELFLDELLKLGGGSPIRATAERIVDADGKHAEAERVFKDNLKKKQLEFVELEKRHFVDSSIAAGRTREEAEEFFDENKAEILAQAGGV